jgi:hypothetical protein
LLGDTFEVRKDILFVMLNTVLRPCGLVVRVRGYGTRGLGLIPFTIRFV